MTEHDVKDVSLAPAGKLKIEWAEQSMPVLRQVRERFANQALSAEYIVKRGKSLEKKVYVVPRDIDLEIARLKLASMDVQIDELTPVQEEYLSSWTHGT